MMLWLVLLPVVSGVCPPPEALLPCQCAQGALSCSGAVPSLSAVLRQGACGARLGSFQLSRAANVSALPDNLFFRVTLNSISISDSPLLEDVGSLLGQELSLEQLSVRSCGLRQLRLSRLQALKTLDLSHNRLSSPLAYLPPSLQSLFLRGNRITSLHPGELPSSLIQLDLSDNRLAYVSRGALPTQLIFLTLSHNLLSELAEGVFEGSGGNLRRVELNDNRLHRLPRGVWATVWGDLDKLDLAGNPIECHLLEDWMKGEEALRPPENLYGLHNCPGISVYREEEPISYNN